MLIGIGGISTQQRNGGVPFKPDSLSGLQLWLKADAGALDASNNPITVDNTNVATWQDQSGNGYHVVQETDASRPKWRSASNGLNGLPGLQWDGTNKDLYRTQKLFTSAISLFIVCKFANTTSRLFTMDLGNSYPTNFGIEQNTYAAAAQTNGLLISGSTFEASGSATTNPQIFALYGPTVVDTNIVSNLTYRVNQSTKTLTQKVGGGAFYNYNFITGFRVGTAQPGNTLNMNGFIYEILVYNVALSATNVGKVETYLSNKWGI
jgi:hypothetical protein